MRTFLFKMAQAPHSGSQLQETLDVILTFAAFDQTVNLLFIDDGVFQLKKQQLADDYGLKDTLAIFNALAVYDVHDLYVEVESLQERGLSIEALALPVKPVFRRNVGALTGKFSVIF